MQKTINQSPLKKLFNPPNVFKELETFAREYDVDIQKTSDY